MSDSNFSTFMMSETTRDQIRALPQDMQLKFFWAVSDFGIDGIEPEFDGVELAVWISMRDLISNSKRHDEAWRNRLRENGKKGGRPRKTPSNEETNRLFEETQETNNDNNNNNDNEKEKKEEKETSEETNRETDKVQEPPFFLDSDSESSEEESGEAQDEALERAIGSSSPGDPPSDATAPPSRSNAGVLDAPGLPAQDFASWFEELRLYWNKVFPEKPYRKTAADVSYGKREDLMGTWRAWSAADCGRAVDNYKRARDSPGLYDLKGCEYPSGFIGFLKNGADAFAGEGALGQFLRKTKEAAREGARVRVEGMRREFDERRGELVRLYKEALRRGEEAEAARILALDEEARRSFDRRMEEVEKEAGL